jgi:hypothetical protein
MAITFDDIDQLVARFGNKVVNEQANLEAPFVGKGTIKKEKHSGTVGIVNVKTGGNKSTGFIADGGPLPDGESADLVQLAYHPKALFTRLSIPRISALTAVSKQDGVNLVREQMESAGADLGRTLGRAIFNTSLATSTHQDAATSTVAYGTLQDAAGAVKLDTSGYRVGARIDGFVDTSAGTALFCEVTAVDHASGIVTMNVFIDSAMATPYSAGNSIADSGASSPTIRGAGTAADTMVSLIDAADSTLASGSFGEAGNYSAVASAGSGYVGNERAVTAGALSHDDIDRLSKDVKRRNGQPWTHAVMNSNVLHAYLNLLVGNRRFTGSVMDPTGGHPTLEGKPIIIDENMPDSNLLLFTDRDVKLAEWRSFGPDFDGKKAAMVSDQSFVYDTQIFGLYNLRVTKRSGLGKLTGITDFVW